MKLSFPKMCAICGSAFWSFAVLKSKGILSDFQKSFLRLFASLPDHERFYLTGGTALAEYYLGHRLSYDLDLFTSVENLILPASYQIENMCQKKRLALKVVRRFSSFVEFLIEQGDESL